MQPLGTALTIADFKKLLPGAGKIETILNVSEIKD